MTLFQPKISKNLCLQSLNCTQEKFTMTVSFLRTLYGNKNYTKIPFISFLKFIGKIYEGPWQIVGWSPITIPHFPKDRKDLCKILMEEQNTCLYSGTQITLTMLKLRLKTQLYKNYLVWCFSLLLLSGYLMLLSFYFYNYLCSVQLVTIPNQAKI